MFNDIFGEVLWEGLIEDKPPDPGEIQATRNGNFLMKCRLLGYLIFFLKCRILLLLGYKVKKKLRNQKTVKILYLILVVNIFYVFLQRRHLSSPNLGNYTN